MNLLLTDCSSLVSRRQSVNATSIDTIVETHERSKLWCSFTSTLYNIVAYRLVRGATVNHAYKCKSSRSAQGHDITHVHIVFSDLLFRLVFFFFSHLVNSFRPTTYASNTRRRLRTAGANDPFVVLCNVVVPLLQSPRPRLRREPKKK